MTAARIKRVEEIRQNALPIEQIVDTFLGDRRDASLRLHVLGDFFFGERLTGSNVVGTFDDDLLETAQHKIMEATRSALSQATPLAIPDGNTFLNSLLAEGHAFAAAALWKRDWLDPSLVARWLPAALVALTFDPKSRIEELIERCFSVGPRETRDAVIGDILRMARQGHASMGRLPAKLWDDEPFRADVIALIHRLVSGSEHERAALTNLLDALLDAYDSPSAPPDVRALLDALLQCSDPTVAGSAARAWFRCWPVESVDRAIAAATTADSADAIFAPYHRWWMRPRKRDLPPPVVARVVRHLLPPLVPFIPPSIGRGGGQLHESLADWRDNLVRWCIDRSAEAELKEAIEAIRQHEIFGAWLSSSESRRRLAAALTSPPRLWPTADQVAGILRRTLKLVHDVADLALLVAEVLRTPWDPTVTTFVYEKQEPAHESKLQVLVREKLIEGLKNVQPPVEATLFREPSERATDEPDFVVSAKAGGQFLEVPIEVKWSDNRPSEGLKAQLGERYLGNAGRSHGVFVVGWMGSPPDVSRLDEELDKARLSEAAQGRTIYVVRKDLRLPTATRTKRNRTGKAIPGTTTGKTAKSKPDDERRKGSKPRPTGR